MDVSLVDHLDATGVELSRAAWLLSLGEEVVVEVTPTAMEVPKPSCKYMPTVAKTNGWSLPSAKMTVYNIL